MLTNSRWNRSWEVVVESPLAAAALTAAKDIITRLRDDELVKTAARLTVERAAYPHTRQWRPVTVGEGSAGLALLCAHLDRCFPEEGWDAVGHRHLSIAVRDL